MQVAPTPFLVALFSDFTGSIFREGGTLRPKYSVQQFRDTIWGTIVVEFNCQKRHWASIILILNSHWNVSKKPYRPHFIDRLGSEALFSVVGKTHASSGYLPKYDLIFDGNIDGSDTGILFANLGLNVGYYWENVNYYN